MIKLKIRSLCIIILSIVLPFHSAFAETICKPGFVLRFASENDEICTLQTTRVRTVAENVRAPMLWAVGPFGPKTCVQGYVWREAFSGDFVCVLPSIRTETHEDNANAPSRNQ